MILPTSDLPQATQTLLDRSGAGPGATAGGGGGISSTVVGPGSELGSGGAGLDPQPTSAASKPEASMRRETRGALIQPGFDIRRVTAPSTAGRSVALSATSVTSSWT